MLHHLSPSILNFNSFNFKNSCNFITILKQMACILKTLGSEYCCLTLNFKSVKYAFVNICPEF